VEEYHRRCVLYFLITTWSIVFPWALNFSAVCCALCFCVASPSLLRRMNRLCRYFGSASQSTVLILAIELSYVARDRCTRSIEMISAASGFSLIRQSCPALPMIETFIATFCLHSLLPFITNFIAFPSIESWDDDYYP